MTFPWETAPARSVEDTVALIQADMRYAVQYTAVLVHSDQPALSMLVNTLRGQLIPRGECVFDGGSKFELQDIGMPQPGAPEMTVRELVTRLWDMARELGLELQT